MILVIADREGTERVQYLLRDALREKTEYLFWDNMHGPDLVLKTDLGMFEHIVIAYHDIRSSDLVTEWVVHRVGAENATKVLNFYRIYNLTLPDTNLNRVMTRNPDIEYEGMILGISHACMGIRPEMFDEPFCNLALHSQDLYYNMISLKRCVEQYPERIRKLRYLILEMYDYTYFNYDASQGSTLLNLLTSGGIYDDPHHMDQNKNMRFSIQQLLSSFAAERRGNIQNEQLTAWKELFTDARLSPDCEYFFNDISAYRVLDNFKSVTKEDIDTFMRGLGDVAKIHPDTVRENISCMKEILRMVYAINPEIQVWVTLMPRSSGARIAAHEIMERWKPQFMECLEQVGEEYDFHFLDLAEDVFGDQTWLYYDAAHLNYMGSAEYTMLLNDMIHGRMDN